MKILFMGTPDFAVGSLKMLNEKYDVVGVFTKPDKVNKRGNKVSFSPVKKYALDNDLKVYQPESVKSNETLDLVRSLKPDIIIVIAYGKILPNELIEIPKFKIINVHASLLPKYRGAAPIHYSIINGDEKTGVSIMYIVEKLDAGDVILQKETKIKEEDILETVYDRLAKLGEEALGEALELIKDGKQNPKAQNESEVSFVKPISKEEAQINWNQTKENIYNFVRGMNPFPCSYTFLNQKRYKIYEVEKVETDFVGEIGEVIDLIKGKGPLIKVENGAVILKQVKPENKKILTGKDLINGNFISKGDRFENRINK